MQKTQEVSPQEMDQDQKKVVSEKQRLHLEKARLIKKEKKETFNELIKEHLVDINLKLDKILHERDENSEEVEQPTNKKQKTEDTQDIFNYLKMPLIIGTSSICLYTLVSMYKAPKEDHNNIYNSL